MSTQEDRDKMMMPQDPNAQNKPRTAKDETNWLAHSGNLESLGGKSPRKKQPTDTPPDDIVVPSSDYKLPPTIVTHDKDGKKTGEHSANDERFSNREVEGINDPSIDNKTPIKVSEEKRKEEDEAANQEEAKASDGVNQSENKPAKVVPPVRVSTDKPNPALKVR